MNTIIIATEVFEAIASRLIDAHTKTGENPPYYITTCHYKPSQIEPLITTWCNLNELTYVANYQGEGEQFATLSRYIDTTKQYKFSEWQFYKWLESLNNNINIHDIAKLRTLTEYEEQSIYLLQRLIEEVRINLVQNADEYRNAEYYTFDKAPSIHKNKESAALITHYNNKPTELIITASVSIHADMPMESLKHYLLRENICCYSNYESIRIVKTIVKDATVANAG